MKIVIIAPHPDDEWIGCGCTLLEKLDNDQKMTVLVITRLPKTERRIRVSKMLAEKYGYSIKVLGEPELHISQKNLIRFFGKNIKKKDIIYIPSYDAHSDHQQINKIARIAFKKNMLFEYAVYNNSLNPFIRLKNKLFGFMLRKGFPSFRKGNRGISFKYKVSLKDKITKDFFREMSRGADILRKVI